MAAKNNYNGPLFVVTPPRVYLVPDDNRGGIINRIILFVSTFCSKYECWFFLIAQFGDQLFRNDDYYDCEVIVVKNASFVECLCKKLMTK